MTQVTTTPANVGLQSKAMVVSLSLTAWSARKFDKVATEEVQQSHGAKKDTGRYNKLLINPAWLKPIQQIDNAARTYHYSVTLPWSDSNERLLPSNVYFDYVREMNFFQSKRDELIPELIANYEDAKQQAKKDLNGLYNEADYLSIAELKSKYTFKVVFMPLPDIDFRLNIGQTEIDRLTAQVQETFTQRITAAVSDLWQRVKEQLIHMKEKLSDKDAIFRDSLFDNLKDIIDLFPNMNITNDANLDAICQEMKDILIDPDKVRQSVKIRNEKAEKVNEILNKFSDFF